MASYPLTGKVALVTGGARGIGFATAHALIARGASVTVVDLDEGTVGAAAQLHDAKAFGLGVDVTDRGAMQRAVPRPSSALAGSTWSSRTRASSAAWRRSGRCRARTSSA